MDLERKIEDCDLVFLDLETTGLDVVTGDSICEIGAFKVKKGKITDKFHSLVNPGRNIPFEAYQIHKISNEDLKGAPYFKDIADKLIDFLKGCAVCAYNAGFDIGFIEHHLKKIGYPQLNTPVIDILSMARDVLKLHRYNLDAAAGSFNIDYDSLHRALDDAHAAYQVFFKLADILKGKKIETLGEFISLYGFGSEIIKLKENERINLLREAVDKNSILKLRFFSSGETIMKEEKVMPLRISQEKGDFFLWYQGVGEESRRIKVNRILDISV